MKGQPLNKWMKNNIEKPGGAHKSLGIYQIALFDQALYATRSGPEVFCAFW